jgi:hypothetical protein
MLQENKKDAGRIDGQRMKERLEVSHAPLLTSRNLLCTCPLPPPLPYGPWLRNVISFTIGT